MGHKHQPKENKLVRLPYAHTYALMHMLRLFLVRIPVSRDNKKRISVFVIVIFVPMPMLAYTLLALLSSFA